MKRAIAGCMALMFVASFAVKPAAAMTVGEEYGWFDNATSPPNDGGSDSGSEGPNCGAGTKTVCKTDSKSVCVEWQSTSATIGFGPASVTISLGTTCKATTVITLFYYYP